MTGETVDMDWTVRKVLASDIEPMGIRPMWTAMGLCMGAVAYGEWMRRQAVWGGGA